MYSEDSQDSEMNEVAPQVEESAVHEQDTQNEIQSDKSEEQAREESRQDRNWREMRRKEQMLQEELKKRDAMLDLLLQKQQNQTQHQQVQEEEDFPDEEYTSGGHVKRIAGKAIKPLEQKILDLERKIAQQEQKELVSGLRSKYPDFDDIVNIETLELLETKEPELAAVIADIKDPYKMGIQSYKYIKALNIAEEVPNARRSKEVSKKIEKNSKSVQSPLAYEKRPMAQAMKLTEADKKALYEEMMTLAGNGSL